MRTAARLATPTLRLDAVANGLLALGIVVGLRPLVDAAGLDGVVVPVILAVALSVNAALCWQATRPARPSPGMLRELAVFDVLFVVALAWFVLADPTAAATWLRFALGVLAVVAAAVGAAKLAFAVRG